MAFNYLPGVQVNTVDGGLTASRTPQAHSTLIIGTAGQGPVNQPYQVTNRSLSASTFGLQGNLIRGQEEVATNSDNVILFRYGTSPQVLSGVGASVSPLNPGFSVGFGQVTTTSSTDYSIWYGNTGVSLAAITPAVVASTTSTPSTATYSLASSSDLIQGTFSVQMGSGTVVTTVIPANSSLATAVSLVTAALSAASVTGVTPTHTSTALVITGIDGTGGSNSFTVSGVLYDATTAAVLSVYYLGSPVYSNNAEAPVDTGDITITGTISGTVGLALGTGTGPSVSNAITILAAAALAGITNTPAPTLTKAITGLGMTGRQAFIAFKQALNLLSGFQVEQIVVPDAVFDAPNVAYYVSGNAATSINNPATNVNALDWLLTTYDGFGDPTFQWASETVNSAGATVSAMSATTAVQRIAANFFEVNWGWEIANFCVNTSTLNNTCIGFIGTSAPVNYSLVNVRKWVGYLPVYDSSNDVVTPGYGLCGIPYVAGTNGSMLNPLTYDYSTGNRQPGFFQTVKNTFEGTVVLDANQNPVDIGSYLHVFADQAILSNGYATNYLANGAMYVAGICSMLDQKVALTNQTVPVIQLPGLVYTPYQLDKLTQVKINVFRYKGVNNSPALLHDYTVATNASDYSTLLRVRIKGLVINTLLTVADPFIGGASLDGLHLTALVTSLNSALSTLNKRGYLSNPQVSVTTTAAEALIGHGYISVTFRPADELIQLDANVGLNPGS
jgi:hypothetical protein